jgi:glycosyltransferase involved in cell wall biosynthesis
LVVLEALACGCRIVVTDQGGPASFIPEGLKDRGYVSIVQGLPTLKPTPSTARRFVDDLAKAIADQVGLPLNREIRREISTSVSHLTWTAYVEKLERLYREVLIPVC